MSEIIYGLHAVQAVLKNSSKHFHRVFILKECRNKRLFLLSRDFRNQGVMVQLVDRYFLNKKSKGAVHQGVVAYIRSNRQSEYHEGNLLELVRKDDLFLLILDNITDPHNLGACLRNADAAGVHAVIVPKDRSANLNAVVRKVACGATENIPLVRVTNLARTMQLLRRENVLILGTTRKASKLLYQSKMIGRIALVMGSEDKGIRRLTSEYCDELIKIPMAGSVSSLNVSVATGICLFEAVRQRK